MKSLLEEQSYIKWLKKIFIQNEERDDEIRQTISNKNLVKFSSSSSLSESSAEYCTEDCDDIFGLSSADDAFISSLRHEVDSESELSNNSIVSDKNIASQQMLLPLWQSKF